MNRLDRELVRKIVGPVSLYRRVFELEQEIQEARKLSQRLSDVIDVITEILVPAADRDDERMRAALARLDAAVKPPVPKPREPSGRGGEPGDQADNM
jgi:hypothetical protein